MHKTAPTFFLAGLLFLFVAVPVPAHSDEAILNIPEQVTTFHDGRAAIQQLYDSYLSLTEQGWILDLVHLSQPAGSPEALPIIALRSPNKGPATWLLAGIHGEEPAGPNAIAAAIDDIAELGRHYPVVLLPLCNPQGYARNWRYLNIPVYSETIEGQSVGDSSHLLPGPDQAGTARMPVPSSPEAEALGRYILQTITDYPPVYSIDLHEDNLIEKGYVYSQGEFGASDPLALAARQVLLDAGIPLELNGRTRFDEEIINGIIGPVTDSSVDELMSSAHVVVDGQTWPGPTASTVLVFETPARNTSLEQRITAHRSLLNQLSGLIAVAKTEQEETVIKPVTKIKARDLGIPFIGTPGKLNAITDVPGVEVGHGTLIRGEGPLVVGEGPVRTGLTVIFPLGKKRMEGVAAATSILNGDGEMTGTHFVEEFGELHGPISITNTLSVGAVLNGVNEWNRQHVTDKDELYARAIPMIAETWDGFLNDIYGQHVQRQDVFNALDAATGGPVAEGNVGGGTGMSTFDFAGGIGTASRAVETEFGSFTLGVLVQSNFGARPNLLIAGVPVGREITDLMPEEGGTPETEGKSLVVIIATDAPLIPTQLKRLAHRAALGMGRAGSIGYSGSGDFFVTFSTGNPMTAYWGKEVNHLSMLPDMNPFFEAVVQAVEEAIVNAMVASSTMTGINGNTVHALPHERVQQVLRKYNRLQE
jgi:D-aminopeptidase